VSARAAFFERAERGVRPVAVRLMGDRTDETHRCREGEPVPALAEAAIWIRERLPRNAGGGRPTLDLLCVDADGSLCSWLTAPSGDARVIGALARHGGSEWSGDGEDQDSGASRAPAVLAAYAGVPGEASLQALGAPPEARVARKRGAPAAVEAKIRLPVLAVPDGPARVLVDALDTEGVRVDAVCSLWHAMSAAWDPAGSANMAALRAGREESAAVVAESTAVCASVLVEPSGRLLWTWSRGGSLIAAGSMRLRVERTADGVPGLVRVRRVDASRLAAEWLAWSAQLASAPTRLTCVTPELWASEESGEGSLDAAGLGAALGRALPGATVDLAVDSDPIGTTLRRVAAGLEAAAEAGTTDAARVEAGSSLMELSRRPGQAHFRLYLWSALAIAMSAAGIGALAWKFRAEATELREGARRTAAAARELFQNAGVGAAYPGKELETVQTRVAALEKTNAPIARSSEAAMPILEELETLSLVLGIPEVEIETITLDSRISNQVIVTVPTLAEGEALLGALRSVAGSHLTDWVPTFAPPGSSGRVRCTFRAGWSPESRRPGEASP